MACVRFFCECGQSGWGVGMCVADAEKDFGGVLSHEGFISGVLCRQLCQDGIHSLTFLLQTDQCLNHLYLRAFRHRRFPHAADTGRRNVSQMCMKPGA